MSATRQRILEAAGELFMERWVDEVSLRHIAARAGVGLQTIVRHFGTRDALIDALAEILQESAERERFDAPVGDVKAAVARIVAVMEARGPRVLRALAQEDRVPVMHRIVERGRKTHRRWVATMFEPLLPATEPARTARLAQLAAITDVYTWKLLRVDHGLSQRATEAALVEMIDRLCAEREVR